MTLIVLLLATALIFASVKNRTVELNRFDTVNTLPLRGLLAVGIVLDHTSLFFPIGFESGGITVRNILAPFIEMGPPIVATFLFLSGYGLAFSLKRKGAAYLDGFLKKRFSKLLPELVMLSLIAIPLLNDSFQNIVHDFFTGTPPLPFSWFIYAILYVYIAFYISARLARANQTFTLLFLSGFVIIYIVCLRDAAFGSWWYNAMPALIFGYIVFMYEPAIGRSLSKSGVIITIALICATIAVLIEFVPAFSSLYRIVPFIFIALIYCFIRTVGLPQWRSLNFLGRISLNIYLVHGLFVKSGSLVNLNPYFAIPIILPLSIAGAWALSCVRKWATAKSVASETQKV